MEAAGNNYLANSQAREGMLGGGEYQQEQQGEVDAGGDGLFNYTKSDSQRRSGDRDSPCEVQRKKSSFNYSKAVKLLGDVNSRQSKDGYGSEERVPTSGKLDPSVGYAANKSQQRIQGLTPFNPDPSFDFAFQKIVEGNNEFFQAKPDENPQKDSDPMLTPMTGASRKQLSTHKSSPKPNDTTYDGSRQKSPKTYEEDPTYQEEETPIEDLLFIGSSKGQLVEWSITQQRRVKNFGEFTSSEQLIMTTDNAMRNQFIIGSETQNLAQMDLCDNDQILAWGQVHENSPVHLLVVSPDDSYLLTCDESSRIKQWLIKDQSLLKDFGTCSDTQIHTLLITHHPLQPTCPDPKKSPVFNIFTCDDNGRLKQWSLTKKKNLQIDWPPNLLYPSSHTPNQ